MPITPQNATSIISLKEMANMLGITHDALRKRCNRNQIPSHKYCGKWVFILSEVIDDILTEGVIISETREKEKPIDNKSKGLDFEDWYPFKD